MNILFLCRGNVGRSQMAEAFVQSKHLPGVTVTSAGTKLSGPEMTLAELRPGTNPVIESMAEKNLRIENWRRKNMTDEMVENADFIVSMAEPETEPTNLQKNTKFIRWKVEDPKDKDLDTTRRIRDTIEQLVDTFVKLCIS